MNEFFKSIILVVFYLAVIFLLTSVSQASFNLSDWSEDARQGFVIIGGFGSFVIAFFRWLRIY